MKNVYDLSNNNLSKFLTEVREYVKVGHYIKFRFKQQRIHIKGKVTYITSEYIYVDKFKVQISLIKEIKRISKKEYEED